MDHPGAGPLGNREMIFWLIAIELLAIVFLLVMIVGNQVKDGEFWKVQAEIPEPTIRQGPDAVGTEIDEPTEEYNGDILCKKSRIGY